MGNGDETDDLFLLKWIGSKTEPELNNKNISKIEGETEKTEKTEKIAKTEKTEKIAKTKSEILKLARNGNIEEVVKSLSEEKVAHAMAIQKLKLDFELEKENFKNTDKSLRQQFEAVTLSKKQLEEAFLFEKENHKKNLSRLEGIIKKHQEEREQDNKRYLELLEQEQLNHRMNFDKFNNELKIYEDNKCEAEQKIEVLENNLEQLAQELSLEKAAIISMQKESSKVLREEENAHKANLQDVLDKLKIESRQHKEDVDKLVKDLQQEQTLHQADNDKYSNLLKEAQQAREEALCQAQFSREEQINNQAELKSNQQKHEYMLRTFEGLKRTNKAALEQITNELKIEQELRQRDKQQGTMSLQNAQNEVRALKQEITRLKQEIMKTSQALTKEQLDHSYTQKSLTTEHDARESDLRQLIQMLRVEKNAHEKDLEEAAKNLQRVQQDHIQEQAKMSELLREEKLAHKRDNLDKHVFEEEAVS